VAEAINMLLFTRKAAAPIVRKVIESALANARVLRTPRVDVDGLYVSIGSVDKGPTSTSAAGGRGRWAARRR
jgi:large subunit ribosomal protein L22